MYSKTLLIRIFSKIDKYGSTSRVHKNFFYKRTGSVKTTSDLCADEDATIKSTTSRARSRCGPYVCLSVRLSVDGMLSGQ